VLSSQQSMSMFMSWLSLDFTELTEITLSVESTEGLYHEKTFSR